jgi:cysteine desulfurase
MGIYLDNASSTPIHPEVFSAMAPYLTEHFGNASASHSYGRKVKEAIENNRDTIAALLKVPADTIIFTSNGTEANNMALTTAIAGQGIDHVITTPFEHAAILQTLGVLQKKHNTRVSFLKTDRIGRPDLNHLEYLLRTNTRNLISVRHANNVTGLVNPIAEIAELGHKYNATVHSDTVQTIGSYALYPERLKLDFASASANKFHGPLGAGFLANRSGKRINKLIYGNSPEQQAGTENVPAIVGLAKALEIAYWDIENTHRYINSLKITLIAKLHELVPGVRINGGNPEESLPGILSVSFPHWGGRPLSDYLDDLDITVSGGSDYTVQSIPVFKALGIPTDMETIRFSFSYKNTIAEINEVVAGIATVLKQAAA